jgi:hypothetical protein
VDTTELRRSRAEKATSALVDTEGFVLRAKVMSAKVMDWDGIKTLLRQANTQSFLASGICGWMLWLPGRGQGKENWVEKAL